EDLEARHVHLPEVEVPLEGRHVAREEAAVCQIELPARIPSWGPHQRATSFMRARSASRSDVLDSRTFFRRPELSCICRTKGVMTSRRLSGCQTGSSRTSSSSKRPISVTIAATWTIES